MLHNTAQSQSSGAHGGATLSYLESQSILFIGAYVAQCVAIGFEEVCRKTRKIRGMAHYDTLYILYIIEQY